MDEESSISNSSFNDQENDENFLDKENQRDEQNSDDDEQNRHIFEQQQYQRSQFYQQNQQQQQSYHYDDSNQSLNENSQDNEEMDYDENVTPKSIPDYLIDKISNEKWHGVNGYYSNNNEWKEWHEVSISINPYTNEEIVILPYVPFVTNETSISLDISC